MVIDKLIELERIRSEINRLLSSPLLTTARRQSLAERLQQVERLRAEWERLRGRA